MRSLGEFGTYIFRRPHSLPLTHSLRVVDDVVLNVDVGSYRHLDPFTASGASVWPATAVLTKYLAEEAQRARLAQKSVLELGSGMGLVGMAAAVLGAKSVCLTDRLIPPLHRIDPLDDSVVADSCSSSRGSDEMLKALRTNVDENRTVIQSHHSSKNSSADPPKISVEEIAFGNHDQVQSACQLHGPFDVILGSDITYLEPVLPSLVETLQWSSALGHCHETRPNPALVILAHSRRRSKIQDHLFNALLVGGFDVRQTHEENDVIVVECTR